VICPRCGSEYRKGFTRCGSCDVDLVDENAAEAARARAGDPREKLAGVPTVVIPQASLAAAKELERNVKEAGIVCYVTAAQEEEGAIGSAAAVMYGVALAEADVDRARAHMRGRFEAALVKEGFGALQTEAIEIVEGGDVTCPACGHTGPLVENACGDCGLFLGAIE
jgi:hypothetical protein